MATSAFKDPTNLTRWTVWFLYAQLAVSVIAVISSGIERQIFDAVGSGVYASESKLTAAINFNDAVQLVVSALSVLTFTASGILILRWIYRANFNARQLDGSNLKFSPGWSVGWYFIPIANLWKPYQAMKEIWQTSANPSTQKQQSTEALLPWWWFTWLFYNFTNAASNRLWLRADDIDELLTANAVSLASQTTQIFLCLIFLGIVKRVFSMQMSHVKHGV